ncbi:N-acetylneuraminate synthase [Flavobacterium sp.]|uniref:N-acetylneuraminate synthase n=1 Tax=Flavobacterium sp. TaxID=239 RepID=UPI0040483250
MSNILIIAEAGVNHNGDINLAKKLITEAKNADADFVKFQTFKTELNISPIAIKAEYQINNTGNSQSQFEMVKRLELSFEDFRELKEYSDEVGIGFLSTGFDFPSIDFLNAFEMPFYKIPSGEITNKPYLQHIARKGKDIILSTGMADLKEVKEAIEVIEAEGITRNRITVLHCNTEYPTPMQDVNLLAMNQMAERLGVQIGYSDHTLGIEVPIAAVALGAKVIEKHFTLDRNLPGPDHAASLEPTELKEMVKTIRNIELAISGSGIKEPSESENKNRAIARKSLHLKEDLKKGTVLQAHHLMALRPGDGISPMDIDQVIGKKIIEDKSHGVKLTWEDLI